MKAQKKGSLTVVQGSGNVFADLGVANPEIALVKAELALRINAIIDAQAITQAQAGKVLGIDQAKVSALQNGRLAGFSTERLMRMLNRLGKDIEIVVRSKPRSRKAAHVRVVTA